MIYQLIKALWLLRNRDFIPKLPSRMLASRYDAIPAAERRVLARLGARDPKGVQLAMKRAGVKTIPELVEKLEHYTPDRRVKERLSRMIGRALNASDHHPHARQVVQDGRDARRAAKSADIEERLQRTIRLFK